MYKGATDSSLIEPKEPYVGREPGKHFQGEDLPVRPKKVVHLVTYPNFLSSNDDHSQDRPFTNSSPDRKKKLFMPNEFHASRGEAPPSGHFTKGNRKISVKEGHQALSTINPIEFNPASKGPESKFEVKRNPNRNKSNLCGANAQPLFDEPSRASKRVHSGKYTDSSSMKLSLSYVS
jgi:hypothetical protein